SGSYAARNAALDLLPADVEVVCFTDTDCIVSSGWVREHVKALATADLSGGAIDVTLRRNTSPAEWVDKLRHLKQETWVNVEGYAATANLAVRRSVVEQQRFDSRLRSGGDAEFCRHAAASGLRLVYSADAAVEHPARHQARELRRKVRRIAAGIRANPDRWENRVTPPRVVSLYIPRSAYRAGVSRNPVWLLRAFLLEQWAARQIRRAVVAVKRAKGWPL
ncbi:MAG: glycosyltransferase family 2 protein, partial [Mycobacteriales bacterium]